VLLQRDLVPLLKKKIGIIETKRKDLCICAQILSRYFYLLQQSAQIRRFV
jgi:hypothetical protein